MISTFTLFLNLNRQFIRFFAPNRALHCRNKQRIKMAVVGDPKDNDASGSSLENPQRKALVRRLMTLPKVKLILTAEFLALSTCPTPSRILHF